jgi:hypothetical protein
MPFVKGQPRPLNAGRKKGTPNKKTLERMAREDAAKLLEAKALENGLPLDYMLRVMRDPTVEPHRRDAMAKAAAPYLHPQLAAIHHRHANADGTPIAPVIHLTIAPAPVSEASKPKLTHTGPNDDETVQ